MKSTMNARSLGTINPRPVHEIYGYEIARIAGSEDTNALLIDISKIDVTVYPHNAVVHVSVQDSRSILSDRRDIGEIGSIDLTGVRMPVSRQLWQSALDVRIAVVDPDTHRYLGKTNGTRIEAPDAGNGGAGVQGSAASPIVPKVISDQILPIEAVIDPDGPVIGLSKDSPVKVTDIRKNTGVVVCALPMAFQVFIRAMVEDTEGSLSSMRWKALRQSIAQQADFRSWDEMLSSYSQGSTDQIAREITDAWYRKSKLNAEVQLIAEAGTTSDTNIQDDE